MGPYSCNSGVRSTCHTLRPAGSRTPPSAPPLRTAGYALVGVGTAVAQQLSGTDALFYNYVKAADAVGFSRLWKVYATLVGFGTCKLITAFASMYLLDTVGTCVEIKLGAPHAIDATLFP